MTGCIANLYGSLEKLDESYLQPNKNKDSILNPPIPTQVTHPNFLLPDTNRKPENQKLYYCPQHPGFVSDIQNSVCSQCKSSRGFVTFGDFGSSGGFRSSCFSEEVKFAVTNDSTSTDTATSDQGGYVKGLVTYKVTDELSVSPLSMVSAVSLLNKFDIKDFGVLKEKVVEFGNNEGIELLKASLFSKDALTAVFLLNSQRQRWRASIKLEKRGVDTFSSLSKFTRKLVGNKFENLKLFLDCSHDYSDCSGLCLAFSFIFHCCFILNSVK